jgi:ribosomal protein L3 glutamine methyltransferase
VSYQLSEKLINEAKDQLHTLGDWLRWVTSRLDEAEVYFGHGTDNPWDEASALVLPALRLPFDVPESLYPSRITDTEKEVIIQFLIERVNLRKPLAYITGQAYFCGLPFTVDERVLVPRSPIAELIEQRFAQWIEPDSVEAILDLCTGSGCIAIACAYHFPDAFVMGTDISLDALAVAEINVQQHQLEDRLCLLQSDVFDQIPEQQFDIIVSNPPYVDAEDMADLPDEYRKEPELGLASGEDGLDITRKILKQAANYLTEQGILVIEVGNSWPALVEAYPQLDFQWVEFTRGGDGVFVLTREQLIAAGEL